MKKSNKGFFYTHTKVSKLIDPKTGKYVKAHDGIVMKFRDYYNGSNIIASERIDKSPLDD